MSIAELARLQHKRASSMVEKEMQKMHLDNTFAQHTPTPEQKSRMKSLRNCARTLVRKIQSATPAGPNQTLAIRHLEDALMRANLAILEDAEDAAKQSWTVYFDLEDFSQGPGPFVFATPPPPSGTTNTAYNLTKPAGCPTKNPPRTAVSLCTRPPQMAGPHGKPMRSGAGVIPALTSPALRMASYPPQLSRAIHALLPNGDHSRVEGQTGEQNQHELRAVDIDTMPDQAGLDSGGQSTSREAQGIRSAGPVQYPQLGYVAKLFGEQAIAGHSCACPRIKSQFFDRTGNQV